MGLTLTAPLLSAGAGPGPGHVLLHALAGGDRHLRGARQWLWAAGRHLPLPVSPPAYSDFWSTHPALPSTHLPVLCSMTILPPMEKLRPLLEKLSQFHAKFTQEYS